MTPDDWLFGLKIVSAIGCGLIAGIFFAFSTFVMKALAQQPSAPGIATMQAINITVINPLFMTAFLGTGVACLVVAIASLLKWQYGGSGYVLAGCLLYLIGSVGVTIAGNVPLNDALAVIKPDSLEATKVWSTYLNSWTFWNHVRTIASIAAATLLTLAVSRSAGPF